MSDAWKFGALFETGGRAVAQRRRGLGSSLADVFATYQGGVPGMSSTDEDSWGYGIVAPQETSRSLMSGLGGIIFDVARPTERDLDVLWSKATYVSRENEVRGFRQDAEGAWIRRANYGDRQSPWGWEIDHLTSRARGGTDHISNLRPLHYRNNIAKSDGRPVRAVWAEGTQNVEHCGLLGIRPI